MTDLAAYTRSAGWLGRSFRFYPEIGSTNDVALAASAEGAAPGLVIAADVQMAGRGRVRRRWQAPPGSSLLVSLLFRPPAPFDVTAGRTTMACGLALLETVRAVAGLPVQLKWPNDLIVPPEAAPQAASQTAHDSGGWWKLAGMLSEVGLSATGEPDALVVGIGLNVNVVSEDLANLGPQAGSLLALTGRRFSRAVILDRLLETAERRCAALAAGHDLLPDWREALAWMGQRVEVRAPRETLTGIAEDVDDDGALLVRTPGGQLRRFAVGDVSLRPDSGG